MRGFLKWLFGDSGGPIIPGLFSAGSWLVSQYFQVPFDAGIFRAGAILGMLAGYAVGNVCFVGVDKPNRMLIALSAAAAFIVGVVLMVNYQYSISSGEVRDYWQVLWAITELGLVFGCAGYLMPIAGITFDKPEASEEKTDDEA
jgi:hypothetical protein